MSKMCVLPSNRLLHSSASVARRKGLVRSSPPQTIAGVRTPYYENTVCSLSSFDGSDTTTRCDSFMRFIRLPGGGGVLRRLCIRFLPAAVALRCATCLTFLPANTSPAICAPVVGARFPKTTAQRGNRSEETIEQFPNPCPYGHERR